MLDTNPGEDDDNWAPGCGFCTTTSKFSSLITFGSIIKLGEPVCCPNIRSMLYIPSDGKTYSNCITPPWPGLLGNTSMGCPLGSVIWIRISVCHNHVRLAVSNKLNTKRAGFPATGDLGN